MINIIESIKNYLSLERKGYAPSANYASMVGNPCERYLVYFRLNWKERALPDLTRQVTYRDGNLHEQDVLNLLKESGFDIVETQRPFELEKINVRGKIDGVLLVKKEDMTLKIPLEIKSINPNDFDKINSLDDILNSNKPWIRGYAATFMLYLLMTEQEHGIMIFKCKSARGSFPLKQIDVSLDYKFAEDIYQKMIRVNEHIKKKEYPERIKDRTVCAGCDFRHICLPDEESESINFTDDSEILELLDEREAVRPAAQRFEDLDKVVKDLYFRKQQDGTYLIRDRFQVKITSYFKKFFNIPNEIKKKYEEKKEQQRIMITKIKNGSENK